LGGRQRFLVHGVLTASTLALVSSASLASPAGAQDVPPGEWHYWGATASGTRYSPLEEINAENFEDLEVAWTWRGDNFGPRPDIAFRSVPLYVDGKLFTTAGQRRTVVAIDAGTGETLWTFREPLTKRWEDSPRKNWGKGVAYAEIDGRGVIYMTSPGFFLHALDAETGRPLEGFGKPVPVEGFAPHGTVDMLEYLPRAHPYDPYDGPDPSLGLITTSTPPIVVNGIVIVGSALSDGGGRQTRIENIPGDVLAFDARTGEHVWTFHTIPRPGEFGYDTWEDGAWEWTGNVAVWSPLSADLERGIVYLPTDSPTNDVYGGFRPGDNLFGNSIVAVDARTGERLWHFQITHHDIWDWDLPVPAILADLNVDGEEIPAVIQVTKQGLAFTFNRVTGDPVWPIEEIPVPDSNVPGEQASPTQPVPTVPAPWELQGLTEDDLVDFTPELRQRAVESLADYDWGSPFMPAVHRGNEEGKLGGVLCPGTTGGTNVTGGPAFDPESNILYVASVRNCRALAVAPGSDRDDGQPGSAPGRTVSDWVRADGRFPTLDGLPIFKPPYGSITAIDMDTGEHLWTIPNGDTPEDIAQHELLEGIEIPNTGVSSHANAVVTKTLLIYGEGRGGTERLHAVDKATGERVGTIPLPAPSASIPMTFMHEGQQYLVVPVAGGDLPGSLLAFRLR
jgi:glucose dehydrogenase